VAAGAGFHIRFDKKEGENWIFVIGARGGRICKGASFPRIWNMVKTRQNGRKMI
jgi:hypothetical protein